MREQLVTAMGEPLPEHSFSEEQTQVLESFFQEVDADDDQKKFVLALLNQASEPIKSKLKAPNSNDAGYGDYGDYGDETE